MKEPSRAWLERNNPNPKKFDIFPVPVYMPNTGITLIIPYIVPKAAKVSE